MGVLNCGGLALNVLVFAIVCTKDPAPAIAARVWRSRLHRRRGGRIAEHRGRQDASVHRPDAKLSLLTPVSTPEGESYVRNESLEVSMPGHFWNL